MKNVLKAAACVALLASVSAHAETFDFSYTFNDGPVVTGSLEGTLVGDAVQNISNVHVALNGTSLTVNAVEGNRFSVHLIPYTVEVTSWGEYRVGDHVNIEVDPMARYAARLMETK